jgi:hypothetical protein
MNPPTYIQPTYGYCTVLNIQCGPLDALQTTL